MAITAKPNDAPCPRENTPGDQSNKNKRPLMAEQIMLQTANFFGDLPEPPGSKSTSIATKQRQPEMNNEAKNKSIPIKPLGVAPYIMAVKARRFVLLASNHQTYSGWDQIPHSGC